MVKNAHHLIIIQAYEQLPSPATLPTLDKDMHILKFYFLGPKIFRRKYSSFQSNTKFYFKFW